MAVNLSGGSGRGRKGFGGRSPMSEINVTPLVDVMLVLLIIFMVTAPLLKAGVPVNLPESKAKALGEDKDEVTLSMSRDGRIYLDDVEVPAEELSSRLNAWPRTKSGEPPLVTLRADRALDYGRIMEVMGELNQAGFNSISLITLASGDSSPRDRKNLAP